jgi:hypothetical protein
MRIVYIVLVVCMVSVVACSDSNENKAEYDTGYQPKVKEPLEQSTPQKDLPAAGKKVVRKRQEQAPRFNNSDWGGWEELTEEQHENQVEKISDRLEEIVDEYSENDDLEELDQDTLLEMLREDFPEELQDDIPEEVLEEIEWWTE